MPKWVEIVMGEAGAPPATPRGAALAWFAVAGVVAGVVVFALIFGF